MEITSLAPFWGGAEEHAALQAGKCSYLSLGQDTGRNDAMDQNVSLPS